MKPRGPYRVHAMFPMVMDSEYYAICRSPRRVDAKRIARALNLLEAQERKRATRTGKPDVRYVAAASADQAREFVGENEATWSRMGGAQWWAEKNGLDAWRVSVEKVRKRAGKGKRR